MKRFFCLLVCTVLLLSLFGCSGAKRASGSAQQTGNGEVPSLAAPATDLLASGSGGAETEPSTSHHAPSADPTETEAVTTGTPSTEATTDAPETAAPTDAPETAAPTEKPETAAPTEAPTQSTATEPNALEDNLEALRKQIEAQDAICGVIFLGFTDTDAPAFEAGTDAWTSFLKDSDYRDLQFLQEIPDDHVVDAGGTEVYCLIPLSDRTVKDVTGAVMDEDGILTPGGPVLFEDYGNAPFILRCNVSDIVSNVIVTIMTEDAVLMWEPCLSLDDNHVVVPSEGGLLNLTPAN